MTILGSQSSLGRTKNYLDLSLGLARRLALRSLLGSGFKPDHLDSEWLSINSVGTSPNLYCIHFRSTRICTVVLEMPPHDARPRRGLGLQVILVLDKYLFYNSCPCSHGQVVHANKVSWCRPSAFMWYQPEADTTCTSSFAQCNQGQQLVQASISSTCSSPISSRDPPQEHVAQWNSFLQHWAPPTAHQMHCLDNALGAHLRTPNTRP